MDKLNGSSYREGGGGWEDQGVYMRDKALKLREQLRREYGPNDGVFNGLTFWQTGRTDGVDVKKLVTQHGGQFEQYGLRSVSHIIASNVATSN